MEPEAPEYLTGAEFLALADSELEPLTEDAFLDFIEELEGG